jgi:hypothetical protein
MIQQRAVLDERIPRLRMIRLRMSFSTEYTFVSNRLTEQHYSLLERLDHDEPEESANKAIDTLVDALAVLKMTKQRSLPAFSEASISSGSMPFDPSLHHILASFSLDREMLSCV